MGWGGGTIPLILGDDFLQTHEQHSYKYVAIMISYDNLYVFMDVYEFSEKRKFRTCTSTRHVLASLIHIFYEGSRNILRMIKVLRRMYIQYIIMREEGRFAIKITTVLRLLVHTSAVVL